MIKNEAYEQNLQELNDKWSKYIDLNFKKKYQLDFLEQKDYWFAIQFFSHCSQSYVNTRIFTETLKICIDKQINDLSGAIFVLDTLKKFHES